MSEDNDLFKETLDTVVGLLQRENISCKRENSVSHEIISTNHHKIVYTVTSERSVIRCDDSTEKPISIKVIERKIERKPWYVCSYAFPLERADDVKKCIGETENLIRRLLVNRVYGTDEINVVDINLGIKNIIEDIPKFLAEHIAYFEKRG